jgi:hypothetical protein
MARFALVFGGLAGAGVVGACGLESGGPGGDIDSGGSDVVITDGGVDIVMLPDAPMDIMTPDLGTGETESGMLCTCTPQVPNGWSVVIYNQKMRPACGKDFDMPSNVIENPTAQPATCNCTCSMNPQTQPACTGNVSFGLNFGPANTCVEQQQTIVAGTTCTAGPFGPYSAPDGGGGLDDLAVKANAPSPSGGACGGVNVTKGGPMPTSEQGRTCKPKAAPGTCGQGLCVPTPNAPDGICIQMAGVRMCPGGFPNTHYVGTGATPIFDGRICTPSQGCAFTNMGACSTPSLSFWAQNNPNCNGGPQYTKPSDTSCTQVSHGDGPLTYGSTRYGSNISGAACGYGGACNSGGSVSPANIVTICCL